MIHDQDVVYSFEVEFVVYVVYGLGKFRGVLKQCVSFNSPSTYRQA